MQPIQGTGVNASRGCSTAIHKDAKESQPMPAQFQSRMRHLQTWDGQRMMGHDSGDSMGRPVVERLPLMRPFPSLPTLWQL
jgi:hypothetical protein